MSVLAITVTKRDESGKGAVRRLRNSGQIPGVIYGGESDPVSIKFRHDELVHSLENEAFYSSILNLKLDGKSEKVILRSVHRHPAKPMLLHADFQRVSSKTEITMSVPLHYLNAETSVGVKSGGVVDIMFTEVSIRCLAKDLPESIEVDLTQMNIGDSISLTDITLPKGVKIDLFVGLTDEEIASHDQAIVALHEAKVVSEEEESTEAEVSSDAGDTPADNAD